MMNFNKLTATIENTGEMFVLYNGEEFQNFDKLLKLVGNDYDELHAELMEGITELNGISWNYKKDRDTEEVLTIKFDYEPTEKIKIMLRMLNKLFGKDHDESDVIHYINCDYLTENSWRDETVYWYMDGDGYEMVVDENGNEIDMEEFNRTI